MPTLGVVHNACQIDVLFVKCGQCVVFKIEYSLSIKGKIVVKAWVKISYL